MPLELTAPLFEGFSGFAGCETREAKGVAQ